jgi:hypothetical protein
MKNRPTDFDPVDAGPLVREHFRFGWRALGAFVLFGILLEALHGFKAASYLNVANETRRLMWTLAHAHGTLLALVNLAFGMSLSLPSTWKRGHRRWASSCLKLATLLLPAGFFLGGVQLYGGDPGLGIALVPVGALALLISIFLTSSALGTDGPNATGIRK